MGCLQLKCGLVSPGNNLDTSWQCRTIYFDGWPLLGRNDRVEGSTFQSIRYLWMPDAGPMMNVVIMTIEANWSLKFRCCLSPSQVTLTLNCDDLWPFVAVDIVQEPYISSITTWPSFCKPIPWPDRSSFSSSHLSSTWYFKWHRSRVRSWPRSFISFPFCLNYLSL